MRSSQPAAIATFPIDRMQGEDKPLMSTQHRAGCAQTHRLLPWLEGYKTPGSRSISGGT
jgi:hypothetical protein